MNLHLQFDFVTTLGSYNLQEKDNPFKSVFSWFTDPFNYRYITFM
jgi:hypothetical protein